MTIQQSLINKAVQLLAQRNHSSFELSQKLHRYLVTLINKMNEDEQEAFFNLSPSDLIEETITHCIAQRWLNDDEYIQQFIRVKSQKGCGESRIIYELKQQDFSDTQIREQLEQSEINWFDVCLKATLKKQKSFNELNDANQQKLMKFLYYRGFSHSTIQEVFDYCKNSNK